MMPPDPVSDQKKAPRLAALILTFNEELNIADSVANAFQVADEVVVIDSGSTDRTVEWAQKAGAKVATRLWDNDFAAQRNFALTQTCAPMVLFLDADERLDDELIAAIRSKIDALLTKQYALLRRTHVFGKTFRFGTMRPDWIVRLLPRSCVTWTDRVHERAVCSLPKEKLRGTLLHHSYRDWESWLLKVNSYTTLWAENAQKRGKKSSLFVALGHALYGFFSMLFLRGGILDGLLGIVFCFNHCFYTLMKYLKLAELQRKDRT